MGLTFLFGGNSQEALVAGIGGKTYYFSFWWGEAKNKWQMSSASLFAGANERREEATMLKRIGGFLVLQVSLFA